MPGGIRDLERALAERLGRQEVRLEPLSVGCAWPVFCGRSSGHAPVFVKLTLPAAARRTLSFLAGAGECDFLPRPVLGGTFDFGGHSVLCLEWKEASRLNAEDMSERQADAFLDGCLRLSAVLSGAKDVADPLPEDDPVFQYGQLADYVRRHPLCGRLLEGLTSIPERQRTYGARPLVTIHGDLQPKNYGFNGDRFAAVFDFDDLTKGLACEDATYAFTERCRKSELSAAKLARLRDLFLRMVAASPWDWEAWLVAVNHCRLRIAARRLAKHPDSPFVAFDIRRRDRSLRQLAASLACRFGTETAECVHKP